MPPIEQDLAPKPDYQKLNSTSVSQGKDGTYSKTFDSLVALHNASEGKSKADLKEWVKEYASLSKELIDTTEAPSLTVSQRNAKAKELFYEATKKGSTKPYTDFVNELNDSEVIAKKISDLQGKLSKFSSLHEGLRNIAEEQSRNPSAFPSIEKMIGTVSSRYQDEKYKIFVKDSEGKPVDTLAGLSGMERFKGVLTQFASECKVASKKETLTPEEKKATGEFIEFVNDRKPNPGTGPAEAKDLPGTYVSKVKEAFGLSQHDLSAVNLKLKALEALAKETEERGVKYSKLLSTARATKGDASIANILKAYDADLAAQGVTPDRISKDVESKKIRFEAARAMSELDDLDSKKSAVEHYTKGLLNHPFGVINGNLAALEKAMQPKKAK